VKSDEGAMADLVAWKSLRITDDFPGGNRSTVFAAEFRGRRVVVHHSERAPESLDWELRLLQHLHTWVYRLLSRSLQTLVHFMSAGGTSRPSSGAGSTAFPRMRPSPSKRLTACILAAVDSGVCGPGWSRASDAWEIAVSWAVEPDYAASLIPAFVAARSTQLGAITGSPSARTASAIRSS
jgi:hypothetical protein